MVCGLAIKDKKNKDEDTVVKDEVTGGFTSVENGSFLTIQQVL